MREYFRKNVFRGYWSKNVDNCLKTLETLESMWQLNDKEWLTGLPIILAGNSFDFLAYHTEELETVEDGKTLLRKCYTNEEKSP